MLVSDVRHIHGFRFPEGLEPSRCMGHGPCVHRTDGKSTSMDCCCWLKMYVYISISENYKLFCDGGTMYSRYCTL